MSNSNRLSKSEQEMWNAANKTIATPFDEYNKWMYI